MLTAANTFQTLEDNALLHNYALVFVIIIAVA